MNKETEIALKNYDALVRDKGLDQVSLDWETNTVIYGDGGAVMDVLLDPGFFG